MPCKYFARLCRGIALCIVGCFGSIAGFGAASVEIIDLPDYANVGRLFLSKNGAAFCGAYSTTSREIRTTFRWRRGMGLDLIGDVPGGAESSTPAAISDSGNTILGFGNITYDNPPQLATHHDAFVWNEGAGFRLLPQAANRGSLWGYALSADGSTIADYRSGSYNPNNPSDPVPARLLKNSDLSVTALPNLGDPNTEVVALSADGLTAVGSARNLNRGTRTPVRWDKAQLITLETPSGTVSSSTKNTSADGLITVGSFFLTFNRENPCLWVGTKLEQRLYTRKGAEVSKVSTDGQFVTGYDTNAGLNSEVGGRRRSGGDELLWRRSGATRPLSELFCANGVANGFTQFDGVAPILISLVANGFGSDEQSLFFVGLADDPLAPAKRRIYLVSIPRPEPPQPVIPAELGTLFQRSATLKPAVKFSETFGESLVRRKDVALLEKQEKGAWKGSLLVSLEGVDIAEFTSSTVVKIAVGSFDFTATLGADPQWKTGRRTASLPIQQESAPGIFTKVGNVKISWSRKSATIAVSCDAVQMPLCHPYHTGWRGPLAQTFLARVQIGDFFGVMPEIPGTGTGTRTIKSRGIEPAVGEVFGGLNKVVLAGAKKAL